MIFPMVYLAGAAALLAIAPGKLPAIAATGPAPVMATNAERGEGFRDLAECEAALGSSRGSGSAGVGAERHLAGSLFNRARGNLSRCEQFDGEYLIVVQPGA